MGNSNSQILLSICIPTYNRSKALEGNLKALSIQIIDKELPIELIVSDNCSTDDTSSVVEKYLKNGLSINYIKNSTNLGMDGNFAQCYRKAIGKYVLVLGDDDYLIDGKLEKLLDYLKDSDYGLVHLKTDSKSTMSSEIFNNSEVYLKNISYWITYITSNVVNSKYIKDYNFEKYFGTYLTIVPLYISAAILNKENLLIHERIFKDGIDSKSNGGYNFFEVFIVNYLNIWKDFQNRNKISNYLFNWIKRDILKFFLIRNAYSLLVEKNKNNYILENSISNFKKYYFLNFYFYYDTILYVCKYNIKKLLSYINLKK